MGCLCRGRDLCGWHASDGPELRGEGQSRGDEDSPWKAPVGSTQLRRSGSDGANQRVAEAARLASPIRTGCPLGAIEGSLNDSVAARNGFAGARDDSVAAEENFVAIRNGFAAARDDFATASTDFLSATRDFVARNGF